MSFKKLIEPLLDSLSENEFETPTALQKQCIPAIKGGADVIVVAPEGSGRSTNIVISVIQNLKKSYGDVPRALIMVENKEKALEMEELFNKLARHTDLRVFAAYEEGSVDYQKGEIYIGMDIVISTPRRMTKLYFKSGLNISILKVFAIDDANNLLVKMFKPEIDRITVSLPKCQRMVFTDKISPRFNEISSNLIENPYNINI